MRKSRRACNRGVLLLLAACLRNHQRQTQDFQPGLHWRLVQIHTGESVALGIPFEVGVAVVRLWTGQRLSYRGDELRGQMELYARVSEARRFHVSNRFPARLHSYTLPFFNGMGSIMVKSR
jgi:hypothetical protein